MNRKKLTILTALVFGFLILNASYSLADVLWTYGGLERSKISSKAFLKNVKKGVVRPGVVVLGLAEQIGTTNQYQNFVVGLNAQTGVEAWKQPLEAGEFVWNIESLADVDNDGVNEAKVVYKVNNGLFKVHVLGGKNGNVIYSINQLIEYGASIGGDDSLTPADADLNQDGKENDLIIRTDENVLQAVRLP